MPLNKRVLRVRVARILGATLMASCMTTGWAEGVQSSNPNEFIKSAVETVVKAAKSDPEAKDGDVGATTRVVQREFLPYTNFERTTSLAVGAPWKDATPDQRKQLVQQFTTLLVHTYALQLTQVYDQNVRFRFEPAAVNAKGDDAVVRTQVTGIGSGDDLQVAYRIGRSGAAWRIYDIDMMGVWLIQVYQRQFGDQLARNGLDGLIKYLTDHNARFAK